MAARNPQSKIKIGISSCLLGEKVRWDGGHKRDATVKQILGRAFEGVPICPEVEIGMGIPREAVQLTGNARSPRMVGTESANDWTGRMHRYSQQRARELAKLKVCGYILKSKSPSCGIARIPVYGKDRRAATQGRGLFAGAVIKHRTWIPVEEESRLLDARIRENFITRVFACHRLNGLMAERFSLVRLKEFHTSHQFLLMAHSRKHYATLDQLIARAKRLTPAKLKTRYAEQFMRTLSYKTTVKKNADVLMQMLRLFKGVLPDAKRNAVAKATENYRKGSTPLIKPVTLLRTLAHKHNIEDLKNQVYLNPH